MNCAVDISNDEKHAVIVTEDGSVCTITNDGAICMIRMFQHKIETEYNDDIWELLSQGRVYLRRMPGTKIDESMIDYCLDWLMPFTDSIEIEFYDLINELNKKNNMNDI